MDPPDQRRNRDGGASSVSQAVQFNVPTYGPKQRRRFILCFDGTGNKFQGNEADSNILKIYSMLDKSDGAQFHYYQPGIGTYTTRSSLSSNGMISRISSWYNKAKDSAIGTTLDEHVMAGYKFLMRYYQTGDDIYFFGFSRGSYIARFLAEMLDHVGLLSAGNEELIRFVWKTFAQWQARQGGRSEEERKNAADLLNFMTAFRETFSRPVRRIRFLGLFDTVNSCPKFEAAWMQRSRKFPYTARSSALIIRHAVSIDERRAKFRQDLVSQKKERRPSHIEKTDTAHANGADVEKTRNKIVTNHTSTKVGELQGGAPRFRRVSMVNKSFPASVNFAPPPHMPATLQTPGAAGLSGDRFRSRSRSRSASNRKSFTQSNESARASINENIDYYDSDDEDEDLPQDVEEVWFPGQHGDIGGGWLADSPEKLAMSHMPLVWMVREAQKSGLVFLPEKMKELNCLYYEDVNEPVAVNIPVVPQIEVNDDIVPDVDDSEEYNTSGVHPRKLEEQKKFLEVLESSATRAPIHDCLTYGRGLKFNSVLAWRLMEYLPFRRMDLQPDGTWKAIRWPLPMGEVRDIPDNVKIHNSVIKRMQADADYRPGNLIVGGGGRGVRKAPKELGMGQWVILREEGHPVGEIWVRKKVDKEKDTNGTPT